MNIVSTVLCPVVIWWRAEPNQQEDVSGKPVGPHKSCIWSNSVRRYLFLSGRGGSFGTGPGLKLIDPVWGNASDQNCDNKQYF